MYFQTCSSTMEISIAENFPISSTNFHWIEGFVAWISIWNEIFKDEKSKVFWDTSIKINLHVVSKIWVISKTICFQNAFMLFDSYYTNHVQ